MRSERSADSGLASPLATRLRNVCPSGKPVVKAPNDGVALLAAHGPTDGMYVHAGGGRRRRPAFRPGQTRGRRTPPPGRSGSKLSSESAAAERGPRGGLRCRCRSAGWPASTAAKALPRWRAGAARLGGSAREPACRTWGRTLDQANGRPQLSCPQAHGQDDWSPDRWGAGRCRSGRWWFSRQPVPSVR